MSKVSAIRLAKEYPESTLLFIDSAGLHYGIPYPSIKEDTEFIVPFEAVKDLGMLSKKELTKNLIPWLRKALDV